MFICSVLKIPKESGWKESWDINLSYDSLLSFSEFPDKINISVSNKGKNIMTGGNFRFNFYKNKELYCTAISDDFAYPFEKKLNLKPGENVSKSIDIKNLRLFTPEFTKLEYSDFVNSFKEKGIKITASMHDHHAAGRKIESAPFVFKEN